MNFCFCIFGFRVNYRKEEKMIKFKLEISEDSKKYLSKNADWVGAAAEMKSRIEAIEEEKEVSVTYSVVFTDNVQIWEPELEEEGPRLSVQIVAQIDAIIDECHEKYKIYHTHRDTQEAKDIEEEAARLLKKLPPKKPKF